MGLTEADIHIWIIGPYSGETAPTKFLEALSAGERSRASRFRTLTDSNRWALFRASMRHILAHYKRCDPRELVFDKEYREKPMLKIDPAEERLYFNLSHSLEFALLGITRLCPIGVDIEREMEFDNMGDVAKRNFSINEYLGWRASPDQDKISAFYRCWTRKEAVVKASGQGLYAPLQSFDTPLQKGLTWCGVPLREPFSQKDKYQLSDVEAPQAYVAAAALYSTALDSNRNPEIAVYNFTDTSAVQFLVEK